jgi:Tfp pilus tip-associated adhesin PilY1
MKTHNRKSLIPVLLAAFWLASPVAAEMADYSAVPPFATSGAHSNVLLNLSIEMPMQGAAYNDQPYDANNDGDTTDSGECSGRVKDGKTVGRCYEAAQEYLGIFDPNKAYVYTGGRFVPSGFTNADHSTSGKWSGNFLNWATMTAIDEFRMVMTGGHRVVDTKSETVIQRANLRLKKGHSWYPVKMIKGKGSNANVAPSTVTPFSDDRIYIYNHGYQFDVGTSWGGSQRAKNLNAQVTVCDAAQGLEDNCTDYDGYYKPEGLIQQNANSMRFAVMGYANNRDKDRDGGILRANMKYVGSLLPDGSPNPIAEYGTDGIYINNPEGAPEGDSGVINYINKFGAKRYKLYDPVGELFYECLNYFKNRGPTKEYLNGLSDSEKDGFPALTASQWQDPLQMQCQKNYIVGINDANPWMDKQLPGTHFTSKEFNGRKLGGGDYGEPSNPDPDYNVTQWTNIVGDLQGLTGTKQCIGCTALDCDMSATDKVIPGLGEVMGTCPATRKQNSYYIAGLAYYANTQDIRSDLPGRQTVSTFMIDTQEYENTPLVGEMNMLWLAGKYGGFEEAENDKTDTNSDGNVYEPNLASEWDVDSDGEPDNYVLANQPHKLVSGLTRAFNTINKRASSGTAASVVSNTRSGEGAVYQSIFYPVRNDAICSKPTTNEVEWVGQVHGLFVDEYGNMREDSNRNSQLDVKTSKSGPPIVPDKFIVFDGTAVYKYTDADEDSILDPDERDPNVKPVDLDSINYLWNSSDWLNNSALNPTTQRSYTTVADERYIFTFIDDGDMVAKSNEQVPFTSAQVSKISPYLHLFDPFAHSAASPPPGVDPSDFSTYLDLQEVRLVNYIRGEDQGTISFGSSIIPAMRSRQIDYNCDGTVETWRLGDIIYSTPTLVGRPTEDYDLIYKDDSYTTFYKKYRHRRNVIYVGGNDGMLHAFNGGFFDEDNNRFEKKYAGEAEHELGAELWAYVPFNLLPHLYWLTKPEYSHVYYVDLKPKIFDARIFPADADHPDGWGTVLVCGMRFGGGIIGTDKNHDGTFDAADQQMRSAYIIMDITNPETVPKILAEVTFSDLGFTTAYPTAIVMDPTDTASANDWYLVLGSGPIDAAGPFTTAMNSATSNQEARIYIIDLNAVGTGSTPLRDARGGSLPGAGAFQIVPDAGSFISDPISVDFDLNYKTNAVYFGTISGSTPNWGGKLRRILLKDDTNANSWDADSTLIDVQKPISAAPSVAMDDDGRFWVYFGTGRFFNRNDIKYTDTQSFYGVKEPWSDTNSNNEVEVSELDWSIVLTGNLLDVSNAKVFEDGEDVTGVSVSDTNGNGQISFDELVDEIAGYDGWLFNFPDSGERNLGQAAILGDIVAFTTYNPSSDPCAFEGTSKLFPLYYKTGTAYFRSVIGVGGTPLNGKEEVLKVMDLGLGMTTTPNIHVGSQSGSKAFVQTSTGAINAVEQKNPGVTKSKRFGWKEEQ